MERRFFLYPDVSQIGLVSVFKTFWRLRFSRDGHSVRGLMLLICYVILWVL